MVLSHNFPISHPAPRVVCYIVGDLQAKAEVRLPSFGLVQPVGWNWVTHAQWLVENRTAPQLSRLYILAESLIDQRSISGHPTFNVVTPPCFHDDIIDLKWSKIRAPFESRWIDV